MNFDSTKHRAELLFVVGTRLFQPQSIFHTSNYRVISRNNQNYARFVAHAMEAHFSKRGIAFELLHDAYFRILHRLQFDAINYDNVYTLMNFCKIVSTT